MIENTEKTLPYAVKVDAILATLIGRNSINPEDCTPADHIDKKIDSVLKKAFSAANLTLSASTYSAYVAQSLVNYFDALSEAIQKDTYFSELVVAMEQQS